MLINLTDVLTSEGTKKEIEVQYLADSFSYQDEQYNISAKSPLKLTVENRGKGKAKLDGLIELTFTMKCDRCLLEVPYSMSVSMEREIISPDVKADVDEDDDRVLIGYQIETDELVNNEVLLNWPTKVLCKSDCKGICKVCGKNLNEGTCGCDTFVPDPRMAVIQDIFNASKEV